MTLASMTFADLLHANPASEQNVLRVMFIDWVTANEWLFRIRNPEYVAAKKALILPANILLWTTPYYLLTGLEKTLFLRFKKKCDKNCNGPLS